MSAYPPADKPTMYFIGVTTAKSSINRIFPLWAQALGLGDCQLRGIDFKLHDTAENYRAAVDFIKNDPFSRGALVTTHKLDLCAACRDQFDEIDAFSDALGEVSSIYKRDGRILGRAVDPFSSGLALEAFLPADYWIKNPEAEVLILGAGGSAVALAWHLVQERHGANKPRRIHVANRSTPRLHHLRQVHAGWHTPVELLIHHVPQAEMSDALVAKLPPGSLIVNGTGLGKDAPGSPLTDAVVFPERAYVWEFNYRGNLVFLDQARAQEKSRSLFVEDGWIYFIHGWTRVIADVFDAEIPPRGPVFDRLSEIAKEAR
ncbi:Shikimate 5-dehydrogenase [Verrucomicrobium sp. GAS474]|uniref:shikimate dehydrogenase family protein n=1 Tax=Verrucomicrobium sp. GAS474 TaxID=1882831 RepID=UPI00087B4626|nr:shikimate dehydrogenase [Verrucomicrobium sp. GAS474]SDT98676.1 Shikimate 5-dehydrogenase [Verrucomicrobium sp. GAS474]